MQQQEPSSNFMDFKTIIAIVLVGFVWIGWQSYLKNKYPDAYKVKDQKTQDAKTGQQAAGNSAQTPTKNSANAPVAQKQATIGDKDAPKIAQQPNAKVKETITKYDDEVWSLEFSSKGMGLKNIWLKTYTDRENAPVKIGDNSGYLPFETNIIGRKTPIDFAISKVSDREFVGVANVFGHEITKRVYVDSENYILKTDVEVKGSSDHFSGLVTYLAEKIVPTESSFLLPAYNQQDIFVAHGSTTDREFLTPDSEYRGAFGQVRIFSLGTHYFASSIVDRSDIIPELKVAVDSQTQTAFGILSHQILNRAETFKISYTGFAGPKEVNVLKAVDPAMTEVIDFGWFSWLAIFLFDIMKWFYSIFGNYGVAIILLTILVRIAVLPFNLMSYKSMKTMQVVQPEIKALREKYKDDQQTLNREMMALMKDKKVNPMGGCLPMLLQFPVFIALYRVFGQSIELYKAPFALWIADLSLKDPFYVLPILMAVAFFFQTKLTPSTMDPTQQKIMMFMPVMFAVFMASLPSALTLYMVVTTLFGIGQQLFFMRDRKNEQIVPAKQVKI